VIDAIVPIHNEATTVRNVVAVLCASRRVRSVLVVDDGSKDDGGARALACGPKVRVIRSPVNKGKGTAMLAGVAHLGPRPRVGFFDGDLRGFTVEHVDELVGTHDRGYGMVCGLRDRGIWNPVQLQFPIITGERIVSWDLLARVPAIGWRNYSIEVAMNYAAEQAGIPVALIWLDHLSIRDKTEKVGFWRGLAQHARMAREIAGTRRELAALPPGGSHG
jgi:glycosyltransferase involved in cell wall biosynthesis